MQQREMQKYRLTSSQLGHTQRVQRVQEVISGRISKDPTVQLEHNLNRLTGLIGVVKYSREGITSGLRVTQI